MIKFFILLCLFLMAQPAFAYEMPKSNAFEVEKVEAGKSYYRTFSIIENNQVVNYGIRYKNAETGLVTHDYNHLWGNVLTQNAGSSNSSANPYASINGSLELFDSNGNAIESLGHFIYNTGTIDIDMNFYNLKKPFYDNPDTSGFYYREDNESAIINAGTIQSLKGDFVKNFDHRWYGDASTLSEGGAIHNLGYINSIESDFIGNYVLGNDSYGGAINNKGTISSIKGNFISNYAHDNTNYDIAWGGAIFNTGSINIIEGNFLSNSAHSGAGAIHNTNQITFITGNFIGNTSALIGGGLGANGTGAAISNAGGVIDTIDGSFISNQAHNGGAFYNSGTIETLKGSIVTNTSVNGAVYNVGQMNLIDGFFIGNNASNAGGAIYQGGGSIATINGSFLSNSANIGGAIFNANGSFRTLSGDFNSNYASSSGGAIYNSSNASIGTLNGNFYSNRANNGNGGAIYNNVNATLGSLIGSYYYNTASGAGGAIYNSTNATIAQLTGDFLGNSSNIGGAMYNMGIVERLTGDFISNSSTGNGGAINNTNGTMTIYNASFLGNNSSNGLGGAIFNDAHSILNIATTSDGKDSVFTGNVAKGLSSAIYNNSIHSTINLYASSNEVGKGQIVFNDSIEGIGTLNINDTPTNIDSTSTGTVVINADMSKFIGTTNFYNGTLQVGNGGIFFGGDVNIYGGTLDTRNNAIGKIDITNWTLHSDLKSMIDIDIANNLADTIYNSTGKANDFVINGINIINEVQLSKNDTRVISVADPKTNISLDAAASEVNSALYTYAVNDTELASNGILQLTVKKQNEATENNDKTDNNDTTTEQDIIDKTLDIVDSSTNSGGSDDLDDLSDLGSSDSSGSTKSSKTSSDSNRFKSNNSKQKTLWLLPSASFGSIRFGNDTKVDKYNVLFGYDHKSFTIDSAIKFTPSVYMGYVSSDLEYGLMNSTQNTGVIGVKSSIISDSFYITLSGNVGMTHTTVINHDRTNYLYGEENYSSFIMGLGARIGTHFDLSKRFDKVRFAILPNISFGFSHVNSEDYMNSAGLQVQTDSINAYQITPEMKFNVNLDKMLNAYAKARYSFIFNSNSNASFDTISFKGSELGNYAELAIGVQSKFYGVTLNGEFVSNFGARETLGFRANIKYSF